MSKYVIAAARMYASQLILVIFAARRYSEELPFALFITGLGFVALNKVVTAQVNCLALLTYAPGHIEAWFTVRFVWKNYSQYFVWYLALLPLVLPSSRALEPSHVSSACAIVATWTAAMGTWLAIAFQLEFRRRVI